MKVDMYVGGRVKFRFPSNELEAAERFTLIEFREPRVLVELICDMQIRPTFVYEISEMEGD